MIECMCVVCHGSINHRRSNAIACSANCVKVWYDYVRNDHPVPFLYEARRWHQQQRRDALALMVRISATLPPSLAPLGADFIREAAGVG